MIAKINLFNNNLKSYYIFLFLKLTLLLFIFNGIESKKENSLIDPNTEAETIINFIHSNFNLKNVIYQEKFSEYNISMKFLNIKINDEEDIYLDYDYEKNEGYFSLEKTFIEFILSLNISNNNDLINNPDNKVSIIFNHYINSPILNFRLENLYAKIDLRFIEFHKNKDNTYNFLFYYDKQDFKRNVQIFIDTNNYKYFPKIYKFFNENKEKIEMFLFDSFCNYLGDILSQYPEPVGVTLYKDIVKYLLSIKTFALNITSNLNLEKVIIKEFKEENFIKDSYIKIINISIDMDLLFDDNSKIENFKGIIPEIDITTNFISYGTTDIPIANTTLNTIISNVFDIILFNYIDD